MPAYVKVRLRGGRVPEEGRVEIKTTKNGSWDVICGDGWSLLEAMVVCKSLFLGYASDAMQTDFFGGNLTARSLSGVSCTGNENSLSQCIHDASSTGKCDGRDVAAVHCVPTMADLVIDHNELMRTAHLEDRQMYFLQVGVSDDNKR